MRSGLCLLEGAPDDLASDEGLTRRGGRDTISRRGRSALQYPALDGPLEEREGHWLHHDRSGFRKGALGSY
jgi:hypothetical protein